MSDSDNKYDREQWEQFSVHIVRKKTSHTSEPTFGRAAMTEAELGRRAKLLMQKIERLLSEEELLIDACRDYVGAAYADARQEQALEHLIKATDMSVVN